MPSTFSLFNYFLNSGHFGTFSEEEKLLALHVCSTASEELNANGGCDSSSDSDDEEEDVAFRVKIEATMKNFKEIIRLFREAEKARKKYARQFPKWSPLRLENIAMLRRLARNINTDRLNCNISKITSSCVGVLGGAAVGLAFVFPPAAAVLAVGGLVASSLGGATVFGTSIAEIELLKKNMNKAIEVTKKEKEDFQLVSLWFKHSQELIDAFEKIMGFSVASKMSEDLKNFVAEFGSFAKLRNGKLHQRLVDIIKNFVTKMMPTGISATSLLPPAVSSTAMALIPIAISFFVVIVLMRKHNSLVFDSVVLSHRIAFGMVKLLDLGGDLGVMIAAAAMRAGGAAAADITANTGRIVAHGVFAGIGVAMDLTNLVFASVDVHKGSISPYATQLDQAADQLEKEHEVLQKVYKELFK